MAQARTTGTFPPLEPVVTIRSRAMTAAQRRHVQETSAAAIAGTPEQVGSRLAGLLSRTGAHELVASSSTYDRSALADSDAALAEVFGRDGVSGRAGTAVPRADGRPGGGQAGDGRPRDGRSSDGPPSDGRTAARLAPSRP